MSTLLEIAVNNALACVLLSAVVLVLSRVWNRPAVIHALWVIVLLKTLTPPLVPFSVLSVKTTVGRGGSVAAPTRPSSSADGLPDKEPPLPSSPGVQSLPRASIVPNPAPANTAPFGNDSRDSTRGTFLSSLLHSASANVADAPVPSHATTAPAEPKAGANGTDRQPLLDIHYHPIVPIIWTVGMCWCAAAAGVRVRRFRQLLRLGTPASAELGQEVRALADRLGLRRCPEIVVFDAQISPMLWMDGCRSYILFPETLLTGLDRSTRSTLLLHELAHFRRGDYLVRHLEFLITVIYWWFPLVWWVRRELRQTEEECCDQYVVALAPHLRACYAKALLRVAELLSNRRLALPPLATGVSGYESTRRRLMSIMLAPETGSMGWRCRTCLLAVTALLFPLFPTFARLQSDRVENRSLETSPRVGLAPAPLNSRIIQWLRSKGRRANAFLPTAAVLRKPDDACVAAALAPDGRRLALGFSSGTVQIRDLHSGRAEQEWTSDCDSTHLFAFSSDGRRLAVAGTGNTIEVRDILEQRTVEQHLPEVLSIQSLSYSPDDGMLHVAGTTDERLPCLLSVDSSTLTRRRIQLLDQDPCDLITLSAGGTLVATAVSVDVHSYRVRVLSLPTATTILTIPNIPDTLITQLCLSAEGSALAVLDRQGQIHSWNVRTSQRHATIRPASAPAAIQFAVDGQLVLSVDLEGTASVWDPQDGTCLARLAGKSQSLTPGAKAPFPALASHANGLVAGGAPDGSIRLWVLDEAPASQSVNLHMYLYSVAVSRTGEFALVGGSKGVTRWDLQTGVAQPFGNDSGKAVAVSISPDERQALSGGDRQSVFLWDVPTRTVLKKLEGHTGEVRTVEFAADGQRALSASYDGTAILWDLDSGTVLRRFPTERGRMNAATFSPDGQFVATGDTYAVILWDADSGRLHRRLSTGSPVASLAFTADGRRLVAGLNDATLRQWDGETGAELRRHRGHTQPLESVAVASPDLAAISAAQDGRILAWDLNETLPKFELGVFDEPVKCVRCLPDGRGVICAGTDGVVRCWSLATFPRESTVHSVRQWGAATEVPVTRLIPADHTFRAVGGRTEFVGFLPDAVEFVTAGSDGVVRIWNSRTRELVSELVGHSAGITCGAISHDGRWLATGSWSPEQTVHIWNLESRSRVATLHSHPAPLRALAISHDDRQLATAGEDGVVRLWDLGDYSLQTTLPAQPLPVLSLDFSPRGRQLAVGTGRVRPYAPGEAVLWDLERQMPFRIIAECTALQRAVVYSADGRWLAVKGRENVVAVVDADTGIRRFHLPAAAGPMAFSVDGAFLATGQLDGQIILWDLKNGAPLADLNQHASHVRSLAFSPDGRLLVSAGLEGDVKLWNLRE